MKTCPITQLPIEEIDINTYKILKSDGFFIKHGLRPELIIESEIFKKNKHLIIGAIFTKQLSSNQDQYVFKLTLDNLEDNISKIVCPRTPKEKMDNLFKTLYNFQEEDGETKQIIDVLGDPYFYYKHFFKSKDECIFYLNVLQNEGLINCDFFTGTTKPLAFNITFKGLNYYIEITEKGHLSNKCFVAMSFDSDMIETREAIRGVIEENYYEPVIVDEQNIHSTQTINDAIIAGIKSCKFCVADFTGQKDGVYFESGFAAGQGKFVIYTCFKDDFNKSHFDTNHFPHIIYENLDDLKKKLDDKIKAWIF